MPQAVALGSSGRAPVSFATHRSEARLALGGGEADPVEIGVDLRSSSGVCSIESEHLTLTDFHISQLRAVDRCGDGKTVSRGRNVCGKGECFRRHALVDRAAQIHDPLGLGARVYPDMFSLAQAHLALNDGRIADEQLQQRLDTTIVNFLNLVGASTHYPCLKSAWVKYLGEHPERGFDRVQ